MLVAAATVNTVVVVVPIGMATGSGAGAAPVLPLQSEPPAAVAGAGAGAIASRGVEGSVMPPVLPLLGVCRCKRKRSPMPSRGDRRSKVERSAAPVSRASPPLLRLCWRDVCRRKAWGQCI